MKLILCVDDHLGMMFHKRRQSRDRILCEDILRMTEGHVLRMNAYSYGLFQEFFPKHLQVQEDFLEKSDPNDFCFVENLDASQYVHQIQEIYIYHWNRTYPWDLKCEIRFWEKPWKLREQREFAGNSHEKITLEVYEK